MASSGGGQDPERATEIRVQGECRESSNPEVLISSHEDLFEDDENERPCYLPDSGQEEDETADSRTIGRVGSLETIDGRGEGVSSETKSAFEVRTSTSKETPKDLAGDENDLDSAKDGISLNSLNISSTIVNGNEYQLQEKKQNARGKSLAESSSLDHLDILEGDFSSDRGCDGPPSPSSSQGGTSGYMAGTGSNSASNSSSVSGKEVEIISNSEVLGTSKEAGEWKGGKRHLLEDDTHPSWRGHKKHFFILSNAGKPIYSRYGDEHKLAGFSATLQAIMSFVEHSGDILKHVRAGDHLIVFQVKGPLYLVCISSTGEPFQVLQGQLELLHGQVLLILTKAIEKCFVKNPKFDMRPLLGGTDVVFSSLIHAFSWDPSTYLKAYSCLSLPYGTRQAACSALGDLTDSGALFAMLMCGTKVISLVGPRKASLHPDDLLLLSNFISSSASFRTSESFSPVCLPRYDSTAFMYAYVQYLNKDICLILLTADPNDFFHLKECRVQLEKVLRESDLFEEVRYSIERGGLTVEALPETDGVSSESLATGGDGVRDDAGSNSLLKSVSGAGGAAGLWHFIYRSTYLDQFVASKFSPPLTSRSSQKRLYRAYQKLHASMHSSGASGPHKMQYRRDDHHVLMSWTTSDFELYAAFNPLAEKESAIFISNRVCQWIRDLESEIFLLGATPFNCAGVGLVIETFLEHASPISTSA